MLAKIVDPSKIAQNTEIPPSILPKYWGTLIPAKGNYVSDNWYIFKNNVIQYRKYHKRIQSPFLFDVSQERVLVFLLKSLGFTFGIVDFSFFFFIPLLLPFVLSFFVIVIIQKIFLLFISNFAILSAIFAHIVPTNKQGDFPII